MMGWYVYIFTVGVTCVTDRIISFSNFNLFQEVLSEIAEHPISGDILIC